LPKRLVAENFAASDSTVAVRVVPSRGSAQRQRRDP
jgi:hypothetical protein